MLISSRYATGDACATPCLSTTVYEAITQPIVTARSAPRPRRTPRTSRIPDPTRRTPPTCLGVVPAPVKATAPASTRTGASPRASRETTESSARAYAVSGVRRGLEHCHLGGRVRPALKLEAQNRCRRELGHVRRLGRAEIPLRGHVHANRLRRLGPEVPREECVGDLFVAGVDAVLGGVLRQLVDEMAVVV